MHVLVMLGATSQERGLLKARSGGAKEVGDGVGRRPRDGATAKVGFCLLLV